MPRGAKPKCTRELIDTAVHMKRLGANNKDIAYACGISEAAFYNWMKDPKTDNQVELFESLKKAEVDYKAALRSRVLKASESNWQAAAWMLERQYPEEYARPEVQLARKAAESATDAAIDAMSNVLVEITRTAQNEGNTNA